MSTLVAAPFRAAALPLTGESIAGSSRRPDPGFLTNEPAESKHPSLRIAYFSPVSRHDVLREADELQLFVQMFEFSFPAGRFSASKSKSVIFPARCLAFFRRV